MRIRHGIFALAAVLAAGWALAQTEEALRVYSSNGVRVVLQEMQPQIEQAIGQRISFELSTSRTLVEQIESGEHFDVALLTPALIDGLIASQHVNAGSRQDFARVGIGVGSREGTPATSVATLDDLRQTFLAAKSIAFGANGQSRITNEGSFETLGIADEMRPKTRLTGAGEAPGLVAEGEIELVLTLVSELLREPGVQFLGPLPAEVQGYVDFSAGTSATTGDAAASEALIAYLYSPAFIESLEKHGLEPISAAVH
ncbi:MAG: molybdate ABC transporter substrate-binding protein [Candidatus Rariloculaceae bacterium]